ncbi:MAG: DUF5655 domain-containing protein [Spirochaetia bacterium]|jgi:predicted RNA-binding protein (virulence factor B family)
MALWECPKCGRKFTRANQRHACGTGDRDELLRGRSQRVVATYLALEAFVRTLGSVEVVASKRSALFRSKRIFMDAVVMTDGVRLAIHLERAVADRLFVKIVIGSRHVTHVAKMMEETDLEALKPHILEAYEFSVE